MATAQGEALALQTCAESHLLLGRVAEIFGCIVLEASVLLSTPSPQILARGKIITREGELQGLLQIISRRGSSQVFEPLIGNVGLLFSTSGAPLVDRPHCTLSFSRRLIRDCRQSTTIASVTVPSAVAVSVPVPVAATVTITARVAVTVSVAASTVSVATVTVAAAVAVTIAVPATAVTVAVITIIAVLAAPVITIPVTVTITVTVPPVTAVSVTVTASLITLPAAASGCSTVGRRPACPEEMCPVLLVQAVLDRGRHVEEISQHFVEGTVVQCPPDDSVTDV